MKVLCICEGGNVRSVAAALQLKISHGVDAVAMSWRYNSQETLTMFCEWADAVLILHREAHNHLSGIFADRHDIRDKTIVCDVGSDRWGNPFHHDLQEQLLPKIDRWVAAGFPTTGRPTGQLPRACGSEVTKTTVGM